MGSAFVCVKGWGPPLVGNSRKNVSKNTYDGPEDQEFYSVEEVEKLLRNIKEQLKGTKSNTAEGLPDMLLGLTAAVVTLVFKLRDISKASIERERKNLEDEFDDGRVSTTKTANYINP